MSSGDPTRPGEERSGPPPPGFDSWEEYDAWLASGVGSRWGFYPKMRSAPAGQGTLSGVGWGGRQTWLKSGTRGAYYDGPDAPETHVIANVEGTIAPWDVDAATKATQEWNAKYWEDYHGRNKLPKGTASGAEPSMDTGYMPFGGGGGGGGLTQSYGEPTPTSGFQSERVLGRLEDMRQQALNQNAYQPFLRGGGRNGVW